MARGWESKSIESQQELAREQRADGRSMLSEEAKKLQREREGLLLSRAHVLKQLEASSSERYSEVLRRALAELEHKIASLKSL